MKPCRTTQHCAYHGWCHRCAPQYAALLSRLNTVIGEQTDDHVLKGALYEALARAVRQSPAELVLMAAELADSHLYLATSCLHGDHKYCQNDYGAVGTKVPATCKFCHTPCICPCHAEKEKENKTCPGKSSPTPGATGSA